MSFFKKIIFHIKNGSILRPIKKRLYIRKNILKKDKKNYLVGLGKIMLGYKMNLDNPETFNEKINWYKLHYYDNLMNICADKYGVKKYVESKGLNDILVPTIGLYDDVKKIDFKVLPEKFVVKNTLDSGGVYICRRKKDFSFSNLEKKINSINQEYVYGKRWSLENAYDGINKIIVEKIIETVDGHSPIDYKFFCFNGEPQFFIICADRDEKLKINFYDKEFKIINVSRRDHKNFDDNPPNIPLEKMLDICRVLSKDFPFVRVDLYYENEKIYFGELTFYPSGGFEGFKPPEFDKKFGSFFDINNVKLSKKYVE